MGAEGYDVEENRKLIIAALVVILGGNAGNIISAADTGIKSGAFSTLDAARLEARVLANIQDKCEENEREHKSMLVRLSLAELRINECIRKVNQ